MIRIFCFTITLPVIFVEIVSASEGSRLTQENILENIELGDKENIISKIEELECKNQEKTPLIECENEQDNKKNKKSTGMYVNLLICISNKLESIQKIFSWNTYCSYRFFHVVYTKKAENQEKGEKKNIEANNTPDKTQNNLYHALMTEKSNEQKNEIDNLYESYHVSKKNNQSNINDIYYEISTNNPETINQTIQNINSDSRIISNDAEIENVDVISYDYLMMNYDLMNTKKYNESDKKDISINSDFLSYRSFKGLISLPLDKKLLQSIYDIQNFYPILYNYKSNCYVNVIVQALFNCKDFVSEVLLDNNAANFVLKSLKYYFINFLHLRTCNYIYTLTDIFYGSENEKPLEKDCRDFLIYIFSMFSESTENIYLIDLEEDIVNQVNEIQKLFVLSYEEQYKNCHSFLSQHRYFLQVEIYKSVQKSLSKHLFANESYKSCENCGKQIYLHKIQKIRYLNYPKILVIILNRHKLQNIIEDNVKKTHLVFNNEPITIDANIYMPKTNHSKYNRNEHVQYSLKSMITYQESRRKGHYSIFCKKNDIWRYIDDQNINNKTILLDSTAMEHFCKKNQNAYMLFYEINT